MSIAAESECGVDLEPASPPGALVLPSSAYTSPAVYDRELADVFGRSWVHVADTTELREPGAYVAATIGTTPVLVIRSHDGVLRGFLNVCRHRGATLVEESGQCEHQLRCPYHAWSYATDGRLVGMPFREEFVAQDLNLIPIRIGVAAPLVFACLDREAPAFEHWLGKLAPALERARGSEMTPVCQLDYEVTANWKVAVENALDSYHLPTVHASGEGAAVDLKRAIFETEEYGSSATTTLPDGIGAVLPPRDHLPEWDREHIRMGSLFPNFVGVLMPGTFLYFRYDPLGVERVRLHVRGFEYGTSSKEARDLRVLLLDMTNREDLPILERIQRGMHARGLPPFAYASRLEKRVRHFQSMIQRTLAGTKLRLPHAPRSE